MNKVFILSAPDGADMVRQAEKQLAIDDIAVINNPGHLPEIWDRAVVLFILTEGSLRSPDLLSYIKQVAGLDFPLVPVVEDLAGFNFDDIPSSHTVIKERNTVGIQQRDGPTLIETIQGYLGLSAFACHKKVFISYRRSDAKHIAQEIYRYLWDNHFQVFLDTSQAEGGAVVQKEIVREIEDKDFVLLLDSPDVGSSKWVEEEILQAFARRIPVRIVSIGPGSGLEIIKYEKRIPWSPADSDNLERIRLMISRAIASRESLNARVRRSIEQAAKLRKLSVHNLGNKRFLLRRDRRGVFLEFEDFAISLERLHRLYIGYKQQRNCNMAVFVCGDYPIHKLTRGAVKWARGRSSLEVLPLVELYSFLDQVFP